VVSWKGSFRVTTFISSHELVAACRGHYNDGHRTVRNGAGLCVQSPGGRHHFCLRCDRSDVHNLVQREELKRRLLHDQLVRAASVPMTEEFRAKYGAKGREEVLFEVRCGGRG
jgi:hypothetical protein